MVTLLRNCLSAYKANGVWIDKHSGQLSVSVDLHSS